MGGGDLSAQMMEMIQQENKATTSGAKPACAWVGVDFVARLRRCTYDEAQAWLVEHGTLVRIGSGWVWQIEAPAIQRLGPSPSRAGA